jgi:DNA-binding MarR family transcriptional regulator
MSAHDPNPFAAGGHRSATGVALDRWMAAEKWRSAVEQALSARGLTFKQWLVLAAMDAMTRKPPSGVNQSEIARATRLDEMSVSRAMRALVGAGLVDRNIGGTRFEYRIHPTTKGRRVLEKALAAIAALG